MEKFIMDNPTLFEIEDYNNFVQVGFITKDEYNYLMSTYGSKHKQSEEPSPNESTLNSEVNNDNNVTSNATN